MRRYYGTGYESRPRSIAAVVSIAVACLSIALSTFVLVNRRPAAQPRAFTAPTPATSPTIQPGVGDAPTVEPAPDPQGSIRPADDVSPPAIVNPTRRPRPTCHNSTDPECGRFRWSPAPQKNKPLRLTVEYFPANPVAGEEVTFRVTANDPDAKIDGIHVLYGDGTGRMPSPCISEPRYGTWTPPKQEPDSKTAEFRHVYRAAKTYKASFYTSSGDCDSPYADQATLPVEIVVEPAPEGA